jgi:hypothetical protein
VKIFSPGKGAFLLLAAALLLLLQPLAKPSFFSTPGSQETASHHRCGCAEEKAASGSCGCAERGCCLCCAAPGAKSMARHCLEIPQGPSGISIRAFCCGGSDDLNFISSITEFILVAGTVAMVEDSVLFAENLTSKFDKLSFQPSVPPPENAPTG